MIKNFALAFFVIVALSACGGSTPAPAAAPTNAPVAQATAAPAPASWYRNAGLEVCTACPLEITGTVNGAQPGFDTALAIPQPAQGGRSEYKSVNNPNHSVVNAVMTTGVQGDDNRPVDNVSAFASDIPLIYAVVSTQDSAPGTVISVRWLAVNAQDTPPNTLLASSQIQVEGGVNIAFSLRRDESALWAPGAYRLQVNEDGELDGTIDFAVSSDGASAPSSNSAQITRVITFSETDAAGNPIDVQGEFPVGTRVLGAQVFVTSNAPVEVKAVWYTGIVEGWPPDTKIFEATARATNQSNGIPFTIERTNGEAFPAGRYKLELYLDDILANTTVFHVAGSSVPGGAVQIEYLRKLEVTPEWRVPTALVVAPNTILYVAESGAVRRVTEGFESTRFGEMGISQGDGKLGPSVTGIAADSQSNIWVANPQHSNIQKFSPDGKFLLRFPGDDSQTYDKDGEVNQAYGIAIDKQDNVYVADTLNNRIQKFDTNGKFLGKWTNLGLKSPIGITTDAQGNVYVTDAGNHRVVKVDPQGKLLLQFGKQGAGDGEFNGPWGIALDAAGNIFVTDNFNQRVQVFDAQGKFLTKFGSKGTGEGQFGKPVGVFVAASGNVYVADAENNTIQGFSSNAAPNNSSASPTGGASPGQGRMVADLGFRPGQDGFSFANYGGDYPGEQGDIFVEDLIRMFGEKAVCAGYKDGECQVAPGALEFADILNASSNGGHCEGLAVLSLQMFLGKESRPTYGGTRTPDLKFENQNLQRAIMYYFAWQVVNPVRSIRRASLENGPNRVLDDIIAGIQNNNPVTIAIFNGTGKNREGHAVTPYAVEEMGNGLYFVWVYDNNYPGQERYIEMDRNANTWRYGFAAINPSADPNPWGGGANDKNIGVAPVSLRNGQGECIWCDDTTNVSAGAVTQLALLGGGTMLVTNSQGQRLGWANGEFVNEIPGALEYSIVGGLGKSSVPVFTVPSNDEYEIALEGGALSQTIDAELFVFGGGKSLNIDNITLAPGELNTVALDGNLNTIRYDPESVETSQITMTIDGAEDDYYFAFDGLEIDIGESLAFTFNETEGTLALDSDNGSGDDTYDLTLKRIGDDGTQIYENEDIGFGEDDTEYIDFDGWDGEDDLEIGIDGNDDGSIDEQWQEENER